MNITVPSSRTLHRAMIKRARQIERSDGHKDQRRPLAVAVVGLGYIAQTAVLPAFAKIRRTACIAALVSDDEKKRTALARRYHVLQTFSYDDFDHCLASGIDAVYIALPNDQHRAYAIKAAAAGIHVLCEKPMAMTSADAQAMIAAAKRGKAALMIAYRLHFDPANLHAVALARAGALGDLRYFQSSFSMQVADDGYRLDPGQGGGPLRDLGIYCINAARYLFRAEPISAMAMASRGKDARFTAIDETVSVLLRFPDDRQAIFTASFGAADSSSFQLMGTRGSLRVDPAYDENTGATVYRTQQGRTTKRTFKDCDQFAAEITYFAQCILARREPQPSGQEGAADLRVIEAIEESLARGKAVRVRAGAGPAKRPTARQRIAIPPHAEPKKLVHAAQASR